MKPMNLLYILFQKYHCLLIILLFLSSCTEYNMPVLPDPSGKEWLFPRYITVGLLKDASRISYDEETGGIKQSWEADDEFLLYNASGEYVTYKVSTINDTNASVATFELVDTEQLKGAMFYAMYKNDNINISIENDSPVYDLKITGQTQDASSSYGHIESYDLITASIPDSVESITFKSQGTMLSFIMTDIPTDIGIPQTITIRGLGAAGDIFQNNYNSDTKSSVYELALSGYASGTTSLTANVIVPPFSLSSGSKLGITLTGSENHCRYVGTISDDKDYLSAHRYKFPVSSYTSTSNYTAAMDSIDGYNNTTGWLDSDYRPIGNGSADRPFVIATAGNLAWLKAMVIFSNVNNLQSYYNSNDIYYSLETDIYIEDDVNWKTIGDSGSNTFNSIFQGNGFNITNMNITNATTGFLGFFGQTSGATISDLSVSGTISTTSGSYVGGIIGCMSNTSVSDCDSYVTINATTDYNGGIVGNAIGTITIKDCDNYGTINCGQYSGGIAGRFNTTDTTSIAENCNNYADVIPTGTRIGGIVGDSSQYITITSCQNTGNIGSSTGSYIGGIIGYGYVSTITYCTNSGAITGTTNVGTFIGCNFGGSGSVSDTNTNTGTANGGTTAIGGVS